MSSVEKEGRWFYNKQEKRVSQVLVHYWWTECCVKSGLLDRVWRQEKYAFRHRLRRCCARSWLSKVRRESIAAKGTGRLHNSSGWGGSSVIDSAGIKLWRCEWRRCMGDICKKKVTISAFQLGCDTDNCGCRRWNEVIQCHLAKTDGWSERIRSWIGQRITSLPLWIKLAKPPSDWQTAVRISFTLWNILPWENNMDITDSCQRESQCVQL